MAMLNQPKTSIKLSSKTEPTNKMGNKMLNTANKSIFNYIKQNEGVIHG